MSINKHYSAPKISNNLINEITHPIFEMKIKYIVKTFYDLIQKICEKSLKINVFHCEKINEYEVKWKVPAIFIEKFCFVFIFQLKFQIKEQSSTQYHLGIKYEGSGLFCYDNLQPIQVHSLTQRQQLGRYFLKLNSNFKYGYFLIHPDNGIIRFKANSPIEINWQSLLDQYHLSSLLKIQIHTIIQAIRFHGLKILALSNIISLTRLEKILSSQGNTLISSNNSTAKKYVEDHKKYLMIIRRYLQICDQKNISKDLENNLKIISNAQLTPIMTLIELIKDKPQYQEKNIIQQGGFAQISVAIIKFSIISQNNNLGAFEDIKCRELERYMVIKEEKQRDNIDNNKKDNQYNERLERNRIDNEKRVLEYLQNDTCSQIARYFKIHDEPNYPIIMEYYPHKSIENFLSYNENIGLNSKLWFLLQIAGGLKFLTDKGVYHLDIKPGNVLLTRNFICKISDFGESFIKGVHEEMRFRPGKTFPYAAPEVFQDIIQFNDKMDVFAFGAMMCEMLFDQSFVDYKKSGIAILKTKYYRNMYKSKLNDKSVGYYGPNHLMKLLRMMIFHCTESDLSLRPKCAYLILFLKDILNYLDRMY